MSKHIDEYIKSALNADYIGRLAKKTYTRHLNDLKQANNGSYLYTFSPEEGMRVIHFIEELHHSAGDSAQAGKRLMLEDWQKALLYILFGWRRKSDMRRRFTRSYIEVARKNGKTLLAVGVLLYCWLAEGEAGSQAYCVATKRDQAKIAWNEVKNQINFNKKLKEECRIFQSSITDRQGLRTCKALGRDSKSEDGLNPHFVLVDEYHAHPTADMLEVMDSAVGARSSPLIFIITTAGTSLSSPCYEERETVIKINDAIEKQETTFGIIHTLDEDDDWHNPECWRKANPNIGVSVYPAFMERRAKEAEIKPSMQTLFLTKNLNLWTQSADTWIPIEMWDLCKEDFTKEKLKGRQIAVGVDLSATRDFTAICYATIPEKGRPSYLWWDLLLPCKDGVLERVRDDRVPYDVWIEQGHMQDAGDIVTPDMVHDAIIEVAKHSEIKCVFYDPFFGGILAGMLDKANIPHASINQTYTALTSPITELENGIYEERIRHNGNPVLRWMLQCTTLKTKGDNKLLSKPDRQKTSARIDGIAAAVMAYGQGYLTYAGTTEELVYDFLSI